VQCRPWRQSRSALSSDGSRSALVDFLLKMIRQLEQCLGNLVFEPKKACGCHHLVSVAHAFSEKPEQRFTELGMSFCKGLNAARLRKLNAASRTATADIEWGINYRKLTDDGASTEERKNAFGAGLLLSIVHRNWAPREPAIPVRSLRWATRRHFLITTMGLYISPAPLSLPAATSMPSNASGDRYCDQHYEDGRVHATSIYAGSMCDTPHARQSKT